MSSWLRRAVAYRLLEKGEDPARALALLALETPPTEDRLALKDQPRQPGPEAPGPHPN